MTIASLRLPDVLHQQAARLAAERGESLDELVRDIIEAYLEDMEDARIVAEFEHRCATGNVELLDWAAATELDGDADG